MFCLKVIIAHPDYKRPYTTVIVEHFKTKEEAIDRLNKIKLDYINDHDLVEGDDIAELIEEFDNLLNSSKLSEYIYGDAYTDQLPFEWDIFEVIL